MKKYFVLLLLILSTNLFAQIKLEVSSTKNLHILEGTIDNKYPITMYLIIEESTKKVEGKYYYNNIGDFLYFGESILDKNSKLTLKEYKNNYTSKNSTGQFTGTLNKKMVFKGTWSNGKKSLNFEVKPNKNSIIQEIEIKEYTFIENSYTKTNSGDFEFTAEIPQIANPKKLSSIEKINKELNDLDYLGLYSEWEGTSNPGGTKGGIWYLSNDCEFIYSDNNIISLVLESYIYSGGASGASKYNPILYSLDTGEVLKVTDLVCSVEDKKLITLMQQKLMDHMRQKSGGEDAYESDEELSQFFYDFNSIRLENYTIEPSKITFIYSQGEIAAHVGGRMEISFSYDELKPFVKKSSPLYYLFE